VKEKAVESANFHTSSAC